MSSNIGIESLFADLARIGVKQGDVIYVRSKASAIGRTRSRKALLMALLQSVGPTGTLICPAFTSPSFRWLRNKPTFNFTTPTESGALSRMALDHPCAVRSTHPTHSFVAIGASAKEMLDGHDPSRSAFFPVGKMIEKKTKMLIIGCNKESPGFSTVHYAQEQLGLSQRHLTKYLYCSRFEQRGKLIDWYPTEDPGCSRGFDKMYRHYILSEALQTEKIGNAFTLIGYADELYSVDHAQLRKNPCEIVCDYTDCLSCRILRSYNISSMPNALLRRIANKIYSHTEK